MSKYEKEKYINKSKLIILLTVLLLFSLPVFAEEFTQDILSYTENSIILDSSKITYPSFNIDVPSPSEYKKQMYKKINDAFLPVDGAPQLNIDNTDSENTLPPDEILEESNETTLTPIDNNSTLLQKRIGTDDETENNDSSPFKNFDAFTPPSEYNAKKRLSKPVAEELIPEFTYQANAESNDEYNMEGRTISSFRISGLDKIKPDTVLNIIKIRQGSVFNAELIQKDLQNVYSLGYFTEDMAVEPQLLEDGTLSLELTLTENIVVNNIKLAGNTVYTDNELMIYLNSLKNMPQNIIKINECLDNLKNHYHNNGYILAKIDSVDDNADGTLIITISEGIIEKFEFNEDKKTKDFVITRNMVTHAGDIYNEELMKKDLSRIYATKIFEDVERIINPSPNKDGQYIVTINVKESSSNSVSIGGGVDSALGIFGSVGVHERNFLGRGQYLGANGMVGSGILLSDSSIKNHANYQLELNFREPYFLNADNALDAKLYFRDLGSYQIPLAIERRLGLRGQISHKVRNKDYLTTGLGVGYEYIHLKEGDFNKISSIYRKRNIDISNRSKQLNAGSFINISPSITYDTLDNKFMPREGTIAKAAYIESLGLSNVKNTNGRLAGKVTKYIPIFKKSTLSLTAKGGIKVHGDNVPEIMAFSLGGPYSIRGFRMSGVGTGSSYLMGSAEILTPIPFFDRLKYDVLKNMRFALFVDTGKVFDPTITSKLYDRPLSALSAGVGLRIFIPGVGPISVDYALPFTHVGEYNSKKGYFTFGTSGLYDSF